MKSFTQISFLVVNFVLMGCDGPHPSSNNYSNKKTKVFEIQDSPTNLNVKLSDYELNLTSDLALQNPVANIQNEWLVLSWKNPRKGNAEITFPHSSLQKVRLSLQEGVAAVVITPSRMILSIGMVNGSAIYTCGPQGATCETPIAAATDQDLTYPCGPQGAICRISIPLAK